LLTFYIVGFVHPTIVAWTWGQGWLGEKGFKDFAGTGIVFMLAGCVGFWGAYILGERLGK